METNSCGDFISSGNNENNCLIKAGKESQDFLSLSLFDPQVLLGASDLWDYEYSWEGHVHNTTGKV